MLSCRTSKATTLRFQEGADTVGCALGVTWRNDGRLHLRRGARQLTGSVLPPSALDTLAGDGRVTCIENGKQKVYLALQTSSDAPPEVRV